MYFVSKSFAVSLSNALVEEFRDTKRTVTNFMPTAAASQFTERTAMAGPPVFANTASARAVAQDGYDAMLGCDMDAHGGMTTHRQVMQTIAKWLLKRARLRAVRRIELPPRKIGKLRKRRS